MHLLEVKNLHVEVDEQRNPQRARTLGRKGRRPRDHGPERVGKSTLAHVLAGKPGYEVTQGEVLLDGADVLSLAPTSGPRRGSSSPSSIRWKSPALRR